MKKNVLVISHFVNFPTESGNDRFIYIMNNIDYSKNNVELITSDFFHGKKEKHKLTKDDIKQLPYKVTFIEEPGYKRNISIKRLISHKILSTNLRRYLDKLDVYPDIIYCAVPSLSLAKEVAKFAQKKNIKFIIDIQDLWPEAFKMVFNIPIISNIIFYPMKRNAEYIYRSADSIVAVSDTYANRAAEINKKYNEKVSVYLGTDLDYFDECKEKSNYIKDEKIFEIAYLGTLGSSYEIKNVIDAIKILNDKGINNIRFSLFGRGPLESNYKEYAEEKNVKCEFTGRLDYETMVGRICSSDIAVNPIRKGSAASIINKVGDYAAAGLPVINTQESKEYRKLVEDYNIGFNVDNNNPEQMAEKIIKLYDNKSLREEMGKNNRKLAEEKFDRKKTYLKIMDLIEN